MFKVGDYVTLTDRFLKHLDGCESAVLNAWITPKFFIVENICRASDWCGGISRDQLSVNVYFERENKYLSIAQTDLDKYCQPYSELTYELVNGF